MIYYKFTHLFDARCPQLELDEAELFFRHPNLPCEVNQLGVVYWDPDVETSWMAKESKWWAKYYVDGKICNRVQPINKIVWECYHNEILKNSFKVIQINGNPYDRTITNLEAKKAYEKSTSASERGQFKAATVNYMLSRTPQILKHEMDPDEYWKMLGVPETWINKYWRLWKAGQKAETAGKKPKVWLRHKAQVPAILELRAKGHSWRDIARRLDITHITVQRLWKLNYSVDDIYGNRTDDEGKIIPD